MMRRVVICGLAALLTLAAPVSVCAQNVITTVAGGGERIFPRSVRALDAPLDQVTCAATDTQGNVYLCDSAIHIVARVARDGTLAVVAGNGTRLGGFSGDGGPATSASLNGPNGVAVDAAGNLYIADQLNHRVRKVNRQGVITTVAGNGTAGPLLGDGGPATSASVNLPSGVALDAAGNVYIAQQGDHRVRRVDASGIITTVADSGLGGYAGDGGPATQARLASPRGVAVDAAGSIYIADRLNQLIRKVSPAGIISTVAGNGQQGFSGDGGPATQAALKGPNGVAVDAAGNLYIADEENGRIRKVSVDGIISTVAGAGCGYATDLPVFSGDGGRATAAPGGAGPAACLAVPQGVAVDAAGNLYIADTLNRRIRRVSPAGIITTLAGNGQPRFLGDGGPATSAALDRPRHLALGPAGNLYIADARNHRIRKISPQGTISTTAGNGQQGYSGDGGPATSASLNTPQGVGVDGAGNLYVADLYNNQIRKVTPQGVITTLSLSTFFLGLPTAVAADPSGNVFAVEPLANRVVRISPQGLVTTVAGTGLQGFSGDGGPATSASLNNPVGVGVDGAGNLFIVERLNHRIRRVNPQGTISTVAGSGVSGFSGDGGPATAASLNHPNGVAVDTGGNVYIADTFNHRVRKVSPQGIISTVAGNGLPDFFGDGGLATAALLNGPQGVAVDAAGNVYIADFGNNRIRAVLARTATFSVSPTSLSFAAAAGSGAAPSRQFTLTGSVSGLAWELSAVITSAGGNWLSVSPQAGQMPATVSVSVDATNLAEGTYQGSIEVFAPAAVPAVQTVSVSLTVLAPQPPSLSVQPSALSFQAVTGGTAPPQSLRIENAGSGALSWTAQAATVSGQLVPTGRDWLAVSPAAGNTPADVQVSVNPAGLAVGSYSGSVTVRSAATDQTIVVPVSLLVSTPGGALLLSQGSLLFRAVEAGGAEPPQTFGVLNIGSGTLEWSAEPTVPWLPISPSSGRSQAGTGQIPLISVAVDPAGLSTGFYVGLIRVIASAANNSPQVLRVDLQVLPRGTKLGAVVRPTGLIFVATAGGGSSGPQEVSVATPETEPIEFLSQPIAGEWVRRTPESAIASRDSPGRIVVQPDLGALTPRVYRAGLTVFTKNDGVQHPVSLLFLVLPPGTLPSVQSPTSKVQGPGTSDALSDFGPWTLDLGLKSVDLGLGADCTPSQLILQFASLFANFNAAVGWPSTVLVNARDDCGNAAAGGSVVLSFSSGDPALALADLNNGQYLGSWRPNNALSPLVLVTARGSWRDPQGRSLQGQVTATAQVGLNPNPQSNILSQGGVLLGAGFARGPVAPGSIISLFGRNLAAGESFASGLPLPRTLGGVRVLIGGVEAPLFYVGPGQVNAQVPFELAADRRLQVLVESNGVPSAPEPLQTAGNRPGIFTLGGSFGNQGAILIANTNRLAMPATTAVPSEPAQVGGFISIYCTGLGQTEPAVGSGQPGPAGPAATVRTPVTVTIGGQPAAVSFAGLAPGFAGVYQVNAEVPAGVAPGDAVPVVLTQGSFRSNTATIAVR